MGITYGVLKNSNMELPPNSVKMISTQVRSQGDGMETVASPETPSWEVNCETASSITSRSYGDSFTVAPGKSKEPKFVPYEPYRAAIAPITSINCKSQSVKLKDISNNEQLSSHKMKEPTESSSAILSSVVMEQEDTISNMADCVTYHTGSIPTIVEPMTWLADKVLLEDQVRKLEKEKKELEAHFKVQTKVNADLKKLLVASLGEDMQAKVQYMSEDKAMLGEHVLLYSQELSKNHEELEKARVESDIWKSKFEASRFLVDELAGWKVVLSKKFNEATEAIQLLLGEHQEMYNYLMKAFCALHHTQESFDPTAKRDAPCSESPWNLLQLTSAICCTASEIEGRLLHSSTLSSATSEVKERNHQNFSFTHGEQVAYEVFSSIESLPVLAKAEVSRKGKLKLGAHACQLLPHACSKESTVNCCKHCSGVIHHV